MKKLVVILVVLLLVLHQDFWFWGDTRLVFGFLPVTLFYHAGISVAAAITWYLAIRYAWPHAAIAADIKADTESENEVSA